MAALRTQIMYQFCADICGILARVPEGGYLNASEIMGGLQMLAKTQRGRDEQVVVCLTQEHLAIVLAKLYDDGSIDVSYKGIAENREEVYCLVGKDWL